MNYVVATSADHLVHVGIKAILMIIWLVYLHSCQVINLNEAQPLGDAIKEEMQAILWQVE